MDFKAFKTSQIFGSKLKPEKVVSGTRGGLRPEGLAALMLVNDE